MTIRVIFTTQLRAALGVDNDVVDVVASERPLLLRELLEHLVQRHGKVFQTLVLNQSGTVLPSILICVGDEQVPANSDFKLNDGDEVTFLSAISGG